MAWGEGAKVGRSGGVRPVKDNELVTKEGTPLHRFWDLIVAGAARVRVRDSRGWRYEFESTADTAVDCNAVLRVRLVFKPRHMVVEEVVSVYQVSVEIGTQGTARAVSYCFEVGAWRTGVILLNDVTYV